jgi:hypothetical protein
VKQGNAAGARLECLNYTPPRAHGGGDQTTALPVTGLR